jgi:hypothetical protein
MLTEIFCLVDDFVKTLPVKNNFVLESGDNRRHRNRKGKLSQSEIITIIILFHMSNYRTFKHFYLNHVCVHLRKEFPSLISYARFIDNSKNCMFLIVSYMHSILGGCTGISFMDSTSINVCHNKRINRNKVFDGMAARSKTTMGWFYGFKLHFIINDLGEIISFHITKGNIDDRVPVTKMAKKIFGKIFADKGYLGAKLFKELYDKGIHLITGIKRNMKNRLMQISDKILLRKRFIIETINDKLKNECQIEHTRHRSVHGFIINLIAGLICYQMSPNKPKVRMSLNQENYHLLA